MLPYLKIFANRFIGTYSKISHIERHIYLTSNLDFTSATENISAIAVSPNFNFFLVIQIVSALEKCFWSWAICKVYWRRKVLFNFRYSSNVESRGGASVLGFSALKKWRNYQKKKSRLGNKNKTALLPSPFSSRSGSATKLLTKAAPKVLNFEQKMTRTAKY